MPTAEDLERHRHHAEKLGAQLLYDRSQDEGEPLYVLARSGFRASVLSARPIELGDALVCRNPRDVDPRRTRLV
ncbi:MAG: hypothetical protein WKF73_13250 [Nocardioidaceae bacterium]